MRKHFVLNVSQSNKTTPDIVKKPLRIGKNCNLMPSNKVENGRAMDELIDFPQCRLDFFIFMIIFPILTQVKYL